MLHAETEKKRKLKIKISKTSKTNKQKTLTTKRAKTILRKEIDFSLPNFRFWFGFVKTRCQ